MAIFWKVHAEAARAARAGSEEHVLGDDVLGRHAVLVAKRDEVLDEVSDCEVGRVALATVAELLAGLEPLGRRHVQHLDLVADPLEAALDEEVLREREAADEQRDLGPLRLLISCTSAASSGISGSSSIVRFTLDTAGSSSSGYSKSKSFGRSRGSVILPVSAAAAAVSGEHR